MSFNPLPRSLVAANLTATAEALSAFAWRDYRVALIVWVSLWTVGSRSICYAGFATADIFSMCDRLQVERVNARSNSAEMIDFKANWNWPNEYLVSQTVCADRFPHDSARGITIFIQRPSPEPASAIWFWDGVLLDSFDIGHFRPAHMRARFTQIVKLLWPSDINTCRHVTPFKSHRLGLRSVGALLRPVSNFKPNQEHLGGNHAHDISTR